MKTKKQNKLYLIIPIVLILIWLAISGIGGPIFGKISSVSSNQAVNFLPASADSTKVQNQISEFSSSNAIPAIVLITSSQKISQPDFIHYSELTAKLKNIKGIETGNQNVIGPIPSKDGMAVEYVVEVSNVTNLQSIIKDMRSIASQNVINGDNYYVTGPAGLTSDLIDAFSGIDGVLLYVAIGAVFLILLLVYRSIILPFLVLLTAVFALTGAILVVYYLAKGNVIKLNGQSQGILSILVIGASTDYSLLIVARYKEALSHMTSKFDAIKRALFYSFEPIAASASTVILALLCLLFSDLNSNKSLGPVAAIGIAFSFLAAMTFLPSLLALLGRKAFWPFEPSMPEKNEANNPKVVYRKGVWTAIPNFIEKRYRIIWCVLAVLLFLCALNLFQLKASGTSSAQAILGKSNAVDGQNISSMYFPAGEGSPAEIIASSAQASQTLSIVLGTPGISSANIYNLPGTNSPKIVNGKVLINATLKSVADSPSGIKTITDLRQEIKNANLNALVGGVTAISLDTNNTAKDDLHKIIPIVLLVIFVILILLLRAIVAPLILIGSVILSFAASLGVSAFFFNNVFHFPGSDASVPLFGFIFLVALGVDYNIFLMSRVREESKKSGTRKGILLGLSVTGGVITSAGIVLASTFASLIVIPILFLVQIAFIVSFGVLLDTIIVRTFLVPAINYDIGKKIWWPSRLNSKSKN